MFSKLLDGNGWADERRGGNGWTSTRLSGLKRSLRRDSLLPPREGFEGEGRPLAPGHSHEQPVLLSN